MAGRLLLLLLTKLSTACNMRSICFLFTAALVLSVEPTSSLPTCQMRDFHYEYTECDSSGGRWRVQVPKPNTCVGGAPRPPIRGQGCHFSCNAGQYLDIGSKKQDCKPCPAGTFSLGGGVQFDQWDHIPRGFTVKMEEFKQSHVVSRRGKGHDHNCTSVGWEPKGKYLTNIASECSANLIYTANLVKPGRVSFTYQFTDDRTMFQFMVQNSQCVAIGEDKSERWPRPTDEGKFRTVSVDLKSGMNVLYWRTLAVDSETSQKKMKQPILIKSIFISGIAYTSECSKCRGGSFSAAGSHHCQQCKANTYSTDGAASCSPCDVKTQYAPVGANKCLAKKPCAKSDFYQVYSDCNEKKLTRLEYKWIQPHICSTAMKGAVNLPKPGPYKQCPPCNDGMEFRNKSCHFCKQGDYSDGTKACAPCRPGTAPVTGLSFRQWNSLPKDANITTSCLSMRDGGCATERGWIRALNYMHSGYGHTDDAYLVLSLGVGGFKGFPGIVRNKRIVLGKVTFEFETDCKGPCQLFFIAQSQQFGTKIVAQFSNKQSRQNYTLDVVDNEAVIYSWAFQKKDWSYAWKVNDSASGAKKYTNDVAKLYRIEVTNTLYGGATKCRLCPKGAKRTGCIPCSPGHYANGTSCVACPPNSIVRQENPWGKEACIQCGEGLVARNQMCVSNCHYHVDGKHYDFTRLASPQTIGAGHLFTASGNEYFHQFNISLCSAGKEAALATCAENTTRHSSIKVRGPVCRVTVIPGTMGAQAVTSQPTVLGTVLLSVTSNASSLGLFHQFEKEGFEADHVLDVHFHYVEEQRTSACKQGRSTLITLRCDASQPNPGQLSFPARCPDGTCDGCNYHVIWRSRAACPICPRDREGYEKVVGECRGGKQTVHFYPPKHCILLNSDVKKEMVRTCSVLPLWAQICILGGVAGAVLLLVTLIVCWKKNQNLEYKYMKLVASSGAKGGEAELPAAETCAIDDEDDEEEDVYFKQNSGQKFFNKIKQMGGKMDTGDFESVRLTDRT